MSDTETSTGDLLDTLAALDWSGEQFTFAIPVVPLAIQTGGSLSSTPTRRPRATNSFALGLSHCVAASRTIFRLRGCGRIG
jgi:hypothetical protein